MSQESFTFTPIGYFSAPQKYRFETPRQGIFAENFHGVITLNDDPRLIEACRDLQGVERLWIVFCFHLNEGWRPCVAPPVSPGRRIGTFATRAPYRPNPIGISCVKLEKVECNRLYISSFDLLDGTPVLDIKPYIPQADAFPDAAGGWRDELTLPQWELDFSKLFSSQAEFLLAGGAPDMFNFCRLQLTHEPLNSARRRVTQIAQDVYELGCRTWRIKFRIYAEIKHIEIISIRSNYTQDELIHESEDRYGDKMLHRRFIKRFMV